MTGTNQTFFGDDSRGASSGWMRLLVAMLAFAFAALPAAEAPAIGKDKIIQMSKLDMKASSIIGAIKNADEPPELTAEDIGELRAQGVSDEVISFLKDQGYVEGDAKAEEDEKKAEGETDDGESTEESEAPADDEQKEKEDETKQAEESDSDGDGPAPAPGPAGEGEEEDGEDKSAEQIRKEAEKKMREKQERRDKRKQELRKFQTAAEALEDGDNMEAARIYLKYLSFKPKKSWDEFEEWKGSDNWYEAKFGLAKALYNEGILSGAATPTQQVVMAGADRKHFAEAFRILEELTKKIGYQPPTLQGLTKILTRDLSKELRNDFNYYLGKYFYDYNKNDLAIKYLEKVEEKADDYPEARYLMGVTRLDPAVDDKPAALRNFEEAITVGERDRDANKEILNLGYLALARVFYEVGIYDVALYYYRKIPRSSSRHAEAMFEKAWTYFLKNDFKKALGTFHTLHSPYYEKWYFPDLFILESTVYLNLCKFEYSKRALSEFQTRYLDKRPRLEKFLKKTKKPKAYWKKFTKAFKEGGIAKDGTLPEMFVNSVLNDLEFYNMYKEVRLLRKEKRSLKGNIDALGDFGQEVLDRVKRQVRRRVQEGGIVVQQKLQEINQELEDWDLKATQISFDIDSVRKDELERRLRNKKKKDRVKEAGTTLLVVPDDWQAWPFEGEYWFDEVSNYRSRQSTRCIDEQGQ